MVFLFHVSEEQEEEEEEEEEDKPTAWKDHRLHILLNMFLAICH